jgi:hypothetical protein
MTVVSLFDMIERQDRTATTPDADAGARLRHVAEALVRSLLLDLERLGQDERELTPIAAGNPELELELWKSLWSRHRQWADEAEQVLDRVRRMGEGSDRVADFNRLESAYARTMARLSATPERLASAMGQVRRGEVVSAKELRDELRTRLRA